jgi:hypothetical protein
MASQPPSVEPTIENLIKNNNNYQIFQKLKGLYNSYNSYNSDGDLTEEEKEKKEKETEYNNIVDEIIKQYAKAGFNGTKPPTFINWVHKHIPSFSQSSIQCLKLCFTRFQEEALHSWSPALEKVYSDKRASTSTR